MGGDIKKSLTFRSDNPAGRVGVMVQFIFGALFGASYGLIVAVPVAIYFRYTVYYLIPIITLLVLSGIGAGLAGDRFWEKLAEPYERPERRRTPYPS